jgi:hypothetical protein
MLATVQRIDVFAREKVRLQERRSLDAALRCDIGRCELVVGVVGRLQRLIVTQCHHDYEPLVHLESNIDNGGVVEAALVRATTCRVKRVPPTPKVIAVIRSKVTAADAHRVARYGRWMREASRAEKFNFVVVSHCDDARPLRGTQESRCARVNEQRWVLVTATHVKLTS